MSLAVHLQDIKQRKNSWVTYLRNYRWNHPHRLANVDTSGSLSYTIDERDFTSPGLSASVFEFSLNFASANGYSRNFEPRTPWFGSAGSAIPSGAPAAGEFVMAHRPLNAMWEVLSVVTATTAVTIGTCTETPYTRPTTADPWVAGSASTTDIDFRFTLFLSLGGEPDSGGKGDDSDDEKVDIQFNDIYTGTNAILLPNLATGSGDILRLPWDAAWASETAFFATAFSDHLTAQNTADGGGHSGSCTLSLDFT